MTEKLSIIIASAAVLLVLVVNVYTAHKIIAYVNAATNAVEIEHTNQTLMRLQNESHFLYQVCVDQSREFGLSAADCYNVALEQ